MVVKFLFQHMIVLSFVDLCEGSSSDMHLVIADVNISVYKLFNLSKSSPLVWIEQASVAKKFHLK